MTVVKTRRQGFHREVTEEVGVDKVLSDPHLVRFCEAMGMPALKSAVISARLMVVQE